MVQVTKEYEELQVNSYLRLNHFDKNKKCLQEVINTTENGEWLLWYLLRSDMISKAQLKNIKIECLTLVQELLTDNRSKNAFKALKSLESSQYEIALNIVQDAKDAYEDAFYTTLINRHLTHAAYLAVQTNQCEVITARYATLLINTVSEALYLYYDSVEKGQEILKKCADICRKYLTQY